MHLVWNWHQIVEVAAAVPTWPDVVDIVTRPATRGRLVTAAVPLLDEGTAVGRCRASFGNPERAEKAKWFTEDAGDQKAKEEKPPVRPRE